MCKMPSHGVCILCLSFLLYVLIREMPETELFNKYSKLTSLESAKEKWQEEFNITGELVWNTSVVSFRFKLHLRCNEF